jgi:hypothetical protein
MTYKKPDLKALQAECDAFNAMCPVGGRVAVNTDKSDKPRITTTRTEAKIMAGHTAVVWMDGISGCWSLGHIEPVPEAKVDDWTAAPPTEQGDYTTSLIIELRNYASGRTHYNYAAKMANSAANEIERLTAARQAPTAAPFGYIDKQQLEWLRGRNSWKMAGVQIWAEGEAEDGVPMFVGQAPDSGQEALTKLRYWFESQRKAISKGCGSSWDIGQCIEQIEFIDAAIAQGGTQ